MTMICLYPSKKLLKAAIGQPLKYRETSQKRTGQGCRPYQRDFR